MKPRAPTNSGTEIDERIDTAKARGANLAKALSRPPTARANRSRMGRRRDIARAENSEEYIQKRTKLVKAAARIFRENGLRAASVSDIARAAGMDRASLYYYTSGKEELFNSVVRSDVQELVLFAETVSKSNLPPRSKLRRIIVSLMRSYGTNYPYTFVYIQEDLMRKGARRDPGGREMLKLGKRYDAAVRRIIDDGLQDGSFQAIGPASVLTPAILGMINWTHRWFRPNGPLSADQVAEIFCRLTFNGLVGDGAVDDGGGDDLVSEDLAPGREATIRDEDAHRIELRGKTMRGPEKAAGASESNSSSAAFGTKRTENGSAAKKRPPPKRYR